MNASASLKIVLTTFGTAGDILPFVGLARQLQLLGHRPVVATSRHFQALIERHGVAFAPVAPHHDQILQDQGMAFGELTQRMFDPLRGGQFVLKQVILPYFEQIHAELDAVARDADVLISQPMSSAAFLVARHRRLPWKTVVLQPMPLAFMSETDPPAVHPTLPVHLVPKLLGAKVYGAINGAAKRMSRRWLKPFDDKARELGVYDAAVHPLLEAVFSPQGTVALFPQVFMTEPLAPVLRGQVAFSGFMPFDGGDAALPDDLMAFLAAGSAPVAFTLGTSVVHSPGRFYEACSEACEALGLRAVFLVGEHHQMPNLPDSQMAVKWASHGALFAHCRAVVHQGGIGTASHVLRSGIPHLVVPHAHDQPDNARRLQALGVALKLAPTRAHGARLRRALQRLVNDADLSDAAKRLQKDIGTLDHGPQAARLLLEGLASEPLRQAASF